MWQEQLAMHQSVNLLPCLLSDIVELEKTVSQT